MFRRDELKRMTNRRAFTCYLLVVLRRSTHKMRHTPPVAVVAVAAALQRQAPPPPPPPRPPPRTWLSTSPNSYTMSAFLKIALPKRMLLNRLDLISWVYTYLQIHLPTFVIR